MSQPANADYKMEGPADVDPCDGGSDYCGVLAGFRVTCAECGRRVKVVRGGYTAPHYPLLAHRPT